jgi:large subunit ribosomal protein L15
MRSQVVNLGDLSAFRGDEVTPATLFAAGLVGRPDRPVKILGTGEPGRTLVVRDCAISASARAKIEQAGGRVES